MPKRLAFAAAVSVVFLTIGGQAGAEIGASGLGDPILPHAGNGGYDVSDYDVSLRYEPGKGKLRATNVITAESEATLSRFNLDFRGPLEIRGIEVDSAPAEYRRKGRELQITPPEEIPAGSSFDVRIGY